MDALPHLKRSFGDRAEFVARPRVPRRCQFAPGVAGRDSSRGGTRHSAGQRARCRSSPHACEGSRGARENRRAIEILEAYLREHPEDIQAQKQLVSLRTLRDIPAIPLSFSGRSSSGFFNARDSFSAPCSLAPPALTTGSPRMWTRACHSRVRSSLCAERSARECKESACRSSSAMWITSRRPSPCSRSR